MTFIVAEAHGSCRLFQDYLAEKKYRNVIIGHARSIRYNIGDCPTIKYGDNLKERELIINYFKEILEKYSYEFHHFNDSNSRKILTILENKGKIWLKRLNKAYLQTFQNKYLKKHEVLELFINRISPTIKEVLGGYLGGIPEEIISDMSKELKNRIHDKICEFKLM